MVSYAEKLPIRGTSPLSIRVTSNRLPDDPMNFLEAGDHVFGG